MSTDERKLFIQQLARILTSSEADSVERFDLTARRLLLDDAKLWESPWEFGYELSQALNARNFSWASFHEQDPGVLAHVLGDYLSGHVIAYYGYRGKREHAYLILRPDGLQWHRPLTADERKATTATSKASDALLIGEYDELLSNVQAVVQLLLRRQFMGLINDAEQIAMRKIIQHDLWLLQVTKRSELEQALAFSSLYLRLLALARAMGVGLDDLVNQACETD